jgi:integrase/recombinase XerC
VNQRQLRARIVLDEARALGLDLADLIAADNSSTALPTVSAYLAEIEPTFSAATAATYRPYWRLTTDQLGERRLAEITITDLTAVVEQAAARATRNRTGSTGRASRETCIAALRAVFGRAHAAGLVPASPAAMLRKPRRVRSRRRALDDRELADLIDAVRTTSNDPDLDLLVIRFHLESGARREGALNLRRRDLDPARATVWLREKGESEREQPISPALIGLLRRHAEGRGALRPDDPVLRTSSGIPVTARRYDTLFARARSCLAWAERIPVSAHVLRHTAITAVGRLAGYPVAQAFAGHAPPSVTGRYLHASLAEVAAAVEMLTGQPHPLAAPSSDDLVSVCANRGVGERASTTLAVARW